MTRTDDWFSQNAPDTAATGGEQKPSYYTLFNQLLHTINPATGQPYTGAEAVGMAARDANPLTVPSSAQQYLKGGQAPTLPAEPSANGTTTAGLTDPEAYFQSVTKGLDPTPENLVSLEAQLNQHGIKVLRNAEGTAGKIQLPSGQIVDVIQSAGTGGKAWQWLTGDGGGVGTNAQPFSFQPFTDTFSYDAFKPPTLQEAEAAPGFQAALQEGEKALQRSAAAKGNLLTGGTLKDLTTYAQNAADQNYQNVYNRKLGTYETNYNTAADQFNKRYQQYLDAYNHALQTYGTNFGVNQQLFDNALTVGNTQFQRLYNLANLGLGATEAGAGLGQNYGANAANTITGAGNAAAAGTIGGANAINGAVGKAVSDLSYLYGPQKSAYNPTPGYVGFGSLTGAY